MATVLTTAETGLDAMGNETFRAAITRFPLDIGRLVFAAPAHIEIGQANDTSPALSPSMVATPAVRSSPGRDFTHLTGAPLINLTTPTWFSQS